MGHDHFGIRVSLVMSLVFALTTVAEPATGIAKPVKSEVSNVRVYKGIENYPKVPNLRVYKGIENHPNYVRNPWPPDLPDIRVVRGLSSKMPFTPPSLASRIRDWKTPKKGGDVSPRIIIVSRDAYYPRSLRINPLAWGLHSNPIAFKGLRGLIKEYKTPAHLRMGFKKTTYIKTWFREYRTPPHLRVGFKKTTYIKTHCPPCLD